MKDITIVTKIISYSWTQGFDCDMLNQSIGFFINKITSQLLSRNKDCILNNFQNAVFIYLNNSLEEDFSE